MQKFIEFSKREPKEGDRKISYSQFTMYSNCPKHWELAYIQNLRKFSQSIHTLFGTAMHETLQNYVTMIFTHSAKAADEMDLEAMLRERMSTLYKEAVAQTEEHFSTKEQMAEFYRDGIAIINYMKRNRSTYFSNKNQELVGIEIPICHPALDGRDNILMISYLDVVLRDKRTDEIIILDFKTSTSGWNKYQKADKTKTAQLVIYKDYYAQQYGHDVEKINVEYLILKRKLVEEAMFPQKRIQSFVPASGKPTRNKIKREIEDWIKTCFNEDGSYNTERQYIAIAGKNNKNCKYCDFAKNDSLCAKANRVKE